MDKLGTHRAPPHVVIQNCIPAHRGTGEAAVPRQRCTCCSTNWKEQELQLGDCSEEGVILLDYVPLLLHGIGLPPVPLHIAHILPVLFQGNLVNHCCLFTKLVNRRKKKCCSGIYGVLFPSSGIGERFLPSFRNKYSSCLLNLLIFSMVLEYSKK